MLHHPLLVSLKDCAMNRTSPYLISIAMVLALLVSPAIASGDKLDSHSDSVEETYRIANFVVAYSTPQERTVLSHYSDAGTLRPLTKRHGW
jgi:hypothetical protein